MNATRGTSLVAVALAGIVALAGCGGIGSDDSGGGDSAEAPGFARAPVADEDGSFQDEPGSGPEEDPASGEAGGSFVDQRSIIYTGSIAVRVEDVDAAAARTVALASRLGGFVGADHRSRNEDHSTATLVLRIPSERFTQAVDGLGELGEEEWRRIATEDVTEAVVDLAARIATAEASVERTRALLAQANTIGEIVSVESELSAREARLASLQARQRELADLTALSTITAELLGPEAAGALEQEAQAGFLVGLRSGWDGFLTSVRVLLTVLGFLLPWLIAIGLPVAAVIWWNRRRRLAPATTPAADANTPPA